MSLTQAVTCDGCGQTVQATRLAGGRKYMIPAGWLRLPVWARKSGEDMHRLGEIEICSAGCATFAVKDLFEVCRDPVEQSSPPSAAPGSGSSSSDTDAL